MTRLADRHTGPPTTSSPAGCVHHWRIESPKGHESAGVCQRCGATRSFANSVESMSWERAAFGGDGTGRAAVRGTRVAEITLADEA